MTAHILKYIFYGVLDQACKAATQNSAITIMKNIAFVLTVTNGWSMFYANVISKGPKQAFRELMFRSKSIASKSFDNIRFPRGNSPNKSIDNIDNTDTQSPIEEINGPA
ncbi:hypothetical protein PHYBLDRAFT_68302 [Phycomyces blakesleeanus NRRL 1555(-)]|uniref:Uncharacterized protein n=1 Tax=Phycomyces blakesleeanus (strain ATCC 8743b / DSM 1359 / FGSC 10004 / NBRC 33097 / NRRL 1555) TaxID=763407 RepID=A0A162TED0_PHYB8|nr:hypothetical protein PHYBLDRAFT_68302 [Phycomyces blakesleeanus NRRL 1555(-)]OAD67932.1 hypothetical protein PHYBLDRAFT_68302 [Phycomyces blakesleeanus NRRL 1555(-)]|eukprot:XP_018285972.1 hypothetical protein PHYBLDRAFT_68302 [Phycomyces blakesleeanus NRRL 1555(-)]